jgi:hypothetical protein
MKRSLGLFLTVALGLAGCGGDGEKGIIQHKEKPVPPPVERPEKAEKK